LADIEANLSDFSKEASSARRRLPLPVALVGLGLGAAALALYASDGYDRDMLGLWLISIAMLGAYFLTQSVPLPKIARAELLTPVALALAFAPLYLAGVYEWPVQVGSDEVSITLWFAQNSDLNGADPFGISEYLGHPTVLAWVFGNIGEALGGLTLENMRLVHGFVGLAVVAASYALFRQLSSRSVALVACCVLGLTHSLFMISRMAMRESTAVLIEVVAFALLLRGLRHGHSFLTFAGGLVAGMGFYVYFPSRITFILWLVFLVGLVAFFRASISPRTVLRSAAVALAGFVLVAGPMAIALSKAPARLTEQQRLALLVFPESRALQQQWVGAPTIRDGIETNIEFGLGAFNNERVDRGYAYANPGHGFLDPLTGVLLWVGVGLVGYRLARRRGPPWPLLALSSFLILWLTFAFLVNKAPNYPRLLITLPFVAYLAAEGAMLLARLVGRALANGNARLRARALTASLVVIVAVVGIWNLSIAWDFVDRGRQTGDDIGSTGRYITAASEDPRQVVHIATDDDGPYMYFVWGIPQMWHERLRMFARRPEQVGSVVQSQQLPAFQATPPFVLLINAPLWEQAKPYLQARYPTGRTRTIMPNGHLLAFEVPA
jgi:Dolichyl-phosphate-mannose-protein mannosyltransferase